MTTKNRVFSKISYTDVRLVSVLHKIKYDFYLKISKHCNLFIIVDNDMKKFCMLAVLQK